MTAITGTPLVAPDDLDGTVRIVRCPDGTAYLFRIQTALPWVLRRRYLVPEDLE